jgi:hypothetical protein
MPRSSRLNVQALTDATWNGTTSKLAPSREAGSFSDPERKSRRRFCCDAQRVAATLTPQFVDFPPLEKYLGEV